MEPGDRGRQWCEYAVPNLLPTLRANIARSLSQRYGLSQRQIAARLGLSQAAVSHYVTGRRGGGNAMRTHPQLSKYGDKLGDRIAGGLSGAKLTAAICGACTSLRRGEGIQPCFCIPEGVSMPDFLASLGHGVGFPKQPCETFVVQRLLPLARSAAARHFSASLRQGEVATALGVTQPAVSQYLAGRGGEDALATEVPELRVHIEDLAERLEKGLSAVEARRAFCQICVQFRRGLFRFRLGR